MIDDMQSSDRRLKVLLFLLSFSAAAPGLFLSLEDSEIWGITSSRRIIEDFGSLSSAHIKPLFSVIFGLIVKIAPTDWDAFVLSRVFAVCLGTIGLYSLLSIISLTSNHSHRQVANLTLAGLAMTTPVFLFHFAKARSDMMAASVCMVALVIMTLWKNGRLIYPLSSALVLLITPKSIDLVAVLACFASINSSRLELRDDCAGVVFWRRLRRMAWLISPAAIIFGLTFIFSRKPLLQAFTYWIDSYHETPITSSEHWLHIVMAVESAWIPSVLLATGATTSIFLLISPNRRASLSIIEKAFLLSGLVVAISFLIHPQKYPFFIASRLPFLLLLAIPGWSRIMASVLQSASHSRVTLAGATIFLGNFALSADHIHQDRLFSLHLQKAIHRNLLTYLKKAHPSSYWDAIGLFPKRNEIFHYPSPGDRSNEDILSSVESSKPAIVIRTPKMNLLEPHLFLWLQRKYVPITDEIHLRSLHLFVDLASSEKGCILTTGEILRRAREEGLADDSLILLVKTKTSTTWTQAPFRVTGEGNSAKRALESVDASTPKFALQFNGCLDEGTQYAVSQAGPWKARHVSYSSSLFGYDARLQ